MPGLADEIGEWGVYCFDNAVGYFMRVMHNALLERNTVGSESEPRYSLAQLLEDDFTLPRPPSARKRRAKAGIKLLAFVDPSIVGRWKQAPRAV